jgi:hypothetical protein
MGVDLRLLPIECEQPGNIFSHSVLSCERRYDLFETIRALPSRCGPDVLWSFCSRDKEFEEAHYGNTNETPYGERVMCVYNRDLKVLINHPEVVDNYMNRAIWAYLDKLPDTVRIALFWH